MKQHSGSESGFSYIDVMVAIMILMVGILGALAAITSSVVRSRESQQTAIAKEMANSTLESIFVCRDMARPRSLEAWHQVGLIGTNPVNGVPQGLFRGGWTPIRRDVGKDGIYGTVDDACDGTGTCPNYDGTFNSSEVLQGLERRIEITDLQTPNRPEAIWGIMRRRIDVTVRYTVAGGTREEKVSTIITRFE